MKKKKKKQLQDRIFIISIVNLQNTKMDFWNFTYMYPLVSTDDNCLTNSFTFGTNIPFLQ